MLHIHFRFNQILRDQKYRGPSLEPLAMGQFQPKEQPQVVNILFEPDQARAIVPSQTEWISLGDYDV